MFVDSLVSYNDCVVRLVSMPFAIFFSFVFLLGYFLSYF